MNWWKKDELIYSAVVTVAGVSSLIDLTADDPTVIIDTALFWVVSSGEGTQASTDIHFEFTNDSAGLAPVPFVFGQLSALGDGSRAATFPSSITTIDGANGGGTTYTVPRYLRIRTDINTPGGTPTITLKIYAQLSGRRTG